MSTLNKKVEGIQLRLEYLANPAKPFLVLTVGIAGSGKSTFARELVNENRKFVRVNRDDIRSLLFGLVSPEDHNNYYKDKDLNKREDIVTEVEDSIIMAALHKGKNVIVDNTNLKMKYINHFKKFGHPMELVIFTTPLAVCLERDQNRDRTVGPDVIERQFKQFCSLGPQLGFGEAFRPF